MLQLKTITPPDRSLDSNKKSASNDWEETLALVMKDLVQLENAQR